MILCFQAFGPKDHTLKGLSIMSSREGLRGQGLGLGSGVGCLGLGVFRV